jgi:hypothetical protein
MWELVVFRGRAMRGVMAELSAHHISVIKKAHITVSLFASV